jgi:inositol transport system substrate-binding protein
MFISKKAIMMKIFYKILFILSITLITLYVSSCFKLRGDKIKIGVSFADTCSVEAQQIIKGFSFADDTIKNKSEIIIVSANNDTLQQINQIKDLIKNQKIDILLVHCVNELRAKEFMDVAETEDIPIISMLNIPFGRQVYGYITPNYFLTAKFQSQYVVDATGGRGNVIILAGNTFSDMYSTLTYRNVDYLRKFPNINIVFQKFYNFPKQIEPDVDSLLKLWNNNIQAIIANNDEIILKAVEVLKQKKLDKKIITVGAGCSPAATQAIINNELSMSVDLNYEDIGTKVLTAAVDMMYLIPLKDNGVKYKNDEQKVSWILSDVKAYNIRNIKYLTNKN